VTLLEKPGTFFGNAHAGDIEIINLDGLPEADALRILGADAQGNDRRGRPGTHTP
jgi:hypothetical protein